MSRCFLSALAVAAAAIAFVASPALAATQGCHTAQAPPSAVNVYTEQPQNSGACPKKTVHNSTTSVPTVQQPTYPVQPSVKPVVKPKPTVRKVQKPVATVKVIKISAPASPPPSAVSAAFDLGSGPTALFAALLAAAALLAVGGGLRHGRRR